MKARTILSGMLAIAALSACSRDEIRTSGAEATVASFSAVIDGQRASRAYDTTWDANDKIGITGKSGSVEYTNVAYQTAAGDGNFTVVTDSEKIYYQDDNAVTFTAYYPWGAETPAADTKIQASQKTFDYLWSQSQGSKSSPNVAFIFQHRMAKLVLTVKKGDDVDFTEVQEAVLSLAGFKNNGRFDVTTGTASATDDATAAWIFAGSGNEAENAPVSVDADAETVSYSLILFPQSFSEKLPFEARLTDRQSFAAALDFSAANNAAGDTASGNAWVAGRQYNLSVTLHKTALTVEGCTIEGWTEADGGNIDAR